MKFSEMAVQSKKGIKPEHLPPTEGSAWQHSLRVYLQITYWKTLYDTAINPTEWDWKLAKDYLEPVMTEQVSLVFDELFRSILKMFRIQLFVIEVSLTPKR